MKMYNDDFLTLLQNINTGDFEASDQEIKVTLDNVKRRLGHIKPKPLFKWAYGIVAVAACIAITVVALPNLNKEMNTVESHGVISAPPVVSVADTKTGLQAVQHNKEHGNVILTTRSMQEVSGLFEAALEDVDWAYIMEGKTESEPSDELPETTDISSLENVYEDDSYLYWFHDDGSLFARILVNADQTAAIKILTEQEAVSLAQKEIQKYATGFDISSYTVETTQAKDANPAWRIVYTKYVDDVKSGFIDAEIDQTGTVSCLLFDYSALSEDAIQQANKLTDEDAITIALKALSSEYQIDIAAHYDYQASVTRHALNERAICIVEISRPADWNVEMTQFYRVEIDMVTGEILSTSISR